MFASQVSTKLSKPSSRLFCSPSARPWKRRVHKSAPHSLSESNTAVSSVDEVSSGVPPGCSRYTVALTRPLGLILEEKGGQIVVGEVAAGGAAEREGTVAAGDILISTSGITYTRESDYVGATVRSGEQRVTLNTRGEKFDTVMAAIGTHKAGQPVELTFQRC